MLIDIQFSEASELLWDLFHALPEDAKPQFAKSVDRVASVLHHPSVDGSVVFSVGPDSTREPPPRDFGVI